MSTPDDAASGRAGRLRAAMAFLASEVSETASSLVAADGDGATRPGELAGAAACLVADARELLRFAVAFERRRGTSWQALAEWLHVIGLDSPQDAEDGYGDSVGQLDDMLTECWLLGDAPLFPEAAEDAAGTGPVPGCIDRRVTGRGADRAPPAGEAASEPDCLFPVSWRLGPLDTVEHSSLLAEAQSLITRRRERYGTGDPGVRDLELGLGRRTIELHERMLADELAGKGEGTSPAEQGRLLGAARSRLADLEAAPGKGGPSGPPS